MSSPAGLECSQVDILARWMPSSIRAGVILNPSSELTGSLRHTSAMGTTPLLPNDSFSSEFAPLPASADSSCIVVEGYARSFGGETACTDRPVNDLYPVPARIPDRLFDGLDEMASKSQDLPLMMKLEQLRKWQQHMQEQLKAHQLEELLSLQEEQQRLLEVVNGSNVSTRASSEMSEAEWDEDALSHRPEMNCWEVPREIFGLRQEQLSKGQDSDGADDKEEGMWNATEDDQDQSVDTSNFPEHADALIQPKGVARAESNDRNEEEGCHDRPIRPGIGGQKQTFEEFLEDQLRLEEQRLTYTQKQQSQDGAKAHPKRSFLKRGEGLSRFTNKSKVSLQKLDAQKKCRGQAVVISRSNSAPAFIPKGSSNCVPRFPVQRKTAILNKENRAKGLGSPSPEVRGESKAAHTKVLASHQNQNTEEPERIQTRSQTKQHKPGQVNQYSKRKVNPVSKQVGMAGGPGDDAAKEESGSKAGLTEVRSGPEERRGLLQDSFELSFQEKLQRWECNRQLESMELGEFELLEQAAEELSFSSNSSFVMKVIKMDQEKRQQQVVNGRHQRRLSSTPIKSPQRDEAQKCPSAPHSHDMGGKTSSTDSGASAVERKAKESSEVEDGRCSQGQDKYEICDSSSCGGSEFGDQEVVVRGTVCFPAPSNPPYDRRSYQDEECFRDSASDAAQEDDESDVLSNADNSTLIEDGASQHGRVVFDDDDTWNDMEDTTVGKASDSREVSLVSKATARSISPPEKTLLRKVAVSKAVEVEKSPEPDPPPASQLMTRLFPSLKPKVSSAPPPPPPKPSKDDTVQQAQSRQLRERLVELEIEIERFRKENAALAKLRQENERKREDLRKERLEFEQTKSAELAEFEEYKTEENRKLQKERRLFEKHASAARAIPDKKEREEIQSLKQQLSSLQEEVKRKESRWTSTHSRLRQQVDSLSQENSSLRDEIQMLEKLRISALKKSCITAEKETQTRDGPRIPENNVPSVTKGVTFASPLDSRGSSSSSSSPPQSSAAAATRKNSKDAAGMKSSLRRSAGFGSSSSSSSSSSLPGRRAERPAPASKSQDSPTNQEDLQDCTLKMDLPPKEADSSEAEEPESAQEVITHPDGKIEKVLAGGDRLLVYPNGTRKEVSADGVSVKVTFFNGDTKQITADQRVIYHYAETQTTHITYPNGMEVLHFPNNQTEKHFPDGRKEIIFPDQTVKNLFPDGKEESVLTDGTIIQVKPDGTKEIHFNTGQKEIHTADYKRREYPDGTEKTVYTDGRQETRYPTGRLRIKDKEGNVILDNWT